MVFDFAARTLSGTVLQQRMQYAVLQNVYVVEKVQYAQPQVLSSAICVPHQVYQEVIGCYSLGIQKHVPCGMSGSDIAYGETEC
eukprot:3941956-Rhodomonas_salina.4